jgi:hypothetical protein
VEQRNCLNQIGTALVVSISEKKITAIGRLALPRRPSVPGQPRLARPAPGIEGPRAPLENSPAAMGPISSRLSRPSPPRANHASAIDGVYPWIGRP